MRRGHQPGGAGRGARQRWKTRGCIVDTNVTGTLNLLELCRQHEHAQVRPGLHLQRLRRQCAPAHPETADSDHPLQPYAASKKGAEALCHTYHYLYGIDVTVFRYFTVYGPAGRPDMVMFRFAQWIAEGRPVQLNGDGNAVARLHLPGRHRPRHHPGAQTAGV